MQDNHAISLESPIMIKTFSGFRKIIPMEIVCAKADLQGIKIVYIDGTESDCPISLSSFCEKMYSLNFFRVHRKYIINLHYILEYSSTNATVRMQPQQMVFPVARRNRKAFLNAWLNTCTVIK